MWILDSSTWKLQASTFDVRMGPLVTNNRNRLGGGMDSREQSERGDRAECLSDNSYVELFFFVDGLCMEEISWGYGFNMPTGCFARGKWRCNGVGCILFWTSQWPIVKEEWQFLLLTLLTSFGFSAKDGLFQQDNSLFNCVWVTKIIPLRLGWLPNIHLPSNSPDLSPIENKKCCSKFPAVISDKHYSVIIRPACIDIQAQRFHHLANFLPHRVAARYSGEGKGYVLFSFLLQCFWRKFSHLFDKKKFQFYKQECLCSTTKVGNWCFIYL